MLEIIFSTRNKAYGAYQLRTAYHSYLLRAFLLTLLIIGGLSLLPRFSSMVAAMLPERPIDEYWPDMTEVDITPPPPVPPPAVTPPPPPTRSTVRFVPPLVTDKETKDPEPPSTIDELLKDDTEIGQKTFKTGTNDEPPTFPDTDPNLDLVEPIRISDDDDIIDVFAVQKMPSFPGGDVALMAYLQEHLQYPALARENNIKGTVALQFVVDEKGLIRDLKILKDPGGGCAKEAVRIVTSMPPWLPGEANGHPVRVRFTLPIRFNLL